MVVFESVASIDRDDDEALRSLDAEIREARLCRA
jgi:hypothetical protein